MTEHLRLAPSVLISPSSDGYLAYDTCSESLYRLNPLASLVVELCDGTRGRGALHQLIAPLVGEDRWHACSAWIDTAVRDGLLEPDSEDNRIPISMSADALAALASDLRDDGRVLPAFICRQRATELEPNDPQAWYALGDFAQMVGRRDEARAAYERYFSAHPDDAEMEHMLIALRDAMPPPRASDRCIASMFERFAASYDDTMLQELEYKGPELLSQAVSAVLGNRDALNIVDLGCGTGLVGQRLRTQAARLTGVDLSPAMLRRADERHVYDALHAGEITAFLRRDESGPFDVITAADVFIYFGDLHQVVAPAGRLLAPGGILAFTVERSEVYPFALTDSGRYAHHRRTWRQYQTPPACRFCTSPRESSDTSMGTLSVDS